MFNPEHTWCLCLIPKENNSMNELDQYDHEDILKKKTKLRYSSQWCVWHITQLYEIVSISGVSPLLHLPSQPPTWKKSTSRETLNCQVGYTDQHMWTNHDGAPELLPPCSIKKKTLLRVGILCDYCMSSFHYSLRRVECGLVENHNYTQPGFLFIGFKSHISLFSFNQLAWRMWQISQSENFVIKTGFS